MNIDKCQQCTRLAHHLSECKQEHPDYFAAPVPAFGDDNPHLLIVGLAPGMHGANRTGRPFTGDFAGILLYQTLFDCGVSSAPSSEHARDGLQLDGVRITNAVKCLPPQNKPNTDEVNNCQQWLRAEIDALPDSCRLLVLGRIAHQAVLKAYNVRQSHYLFGHAAKHTLPDGRSLVCSYHCSRYNTQTKRLSPSMFYDVMQMALTK
ncbi:MAG: uracil-DNA glycosylase [Mariprofundales bacterium]